MAYIAFLKPRTLKEKLLACIDGGNFCHCELMIKQYEDGTWLTVSSIPEEGVRIRNVELNGKHWIKVPVIIDVDYCLQWYQDHKQAKYDWFGLINSRYDRDIHARGKYYCSEAVAAMLKIPNSNRIGVKELYEYVIK